MKQIAHQTLQLSYCVCLCVLCGLPRSLKNWTPLVQVCVLLFYLLHLFFLRYPSLLEVCFIYLRLHMSFFSIHTSLFSLTGVAGDWHSQGEETDPSLQLFRGRWADGVLRAGQRLGGAALSYSAPGRTQPSVPPRRMFPGREESLDLWVGPEIWNK